VKLKMRLAQPLFEVFAAARSAPPLNISTSPQPQTLSRETVNPQP
jgi:hypothetical protein